MSLRNRFALPLCRVLLLVLAPASAFAQEGEGGGPGLSCAPLCDVGCDEPGFPVGFVAAITRAYTAFGVLLNDDSLNPETADIDNNGIRDIDHAALVEALLADGDNPNYCCVRAAWDENAPLIEEYLDVLQADTVAAVVFLIFSREELGTMINGLATMGEAATINALLNLLANAPVDIPLPDLSEINRTSAAYLASLGDLDRDGVCNLGEYNAFGGLANPDPEAFAAAALAPFIAADGGGCAAECPDLGEIDPVGEEGEGAAEGEGEGTGPVGCPAVCDHDFSLGCNADMPLPVADWWAGPDTTDVTFIAFGDCQTDSGAPDKNDLNAKAINAVDQIVNWATPYFAVDAPVSQVRGVLMAGDIAQHGRDGRYGTDDNFTEFTDVYGLCGNKQMKFPIFEGYGNHDYFVYDHIGYRIPQVHPLADSVSKRNPYRSGLLEVAPGNAGHYSWEWDNIHFVNVNLCPSDVEPQSNVPGDRDPRGALSFLRYTLEKHVAGKPKRVIVMSHYGFYQGWDFAGWWTPAEADAYYDVVKDYDLIAHIHGHAHNTQYYTWKGIDVFNVGSPYYETPRWNPDGRGRFAIFRITNDTMYVGDAAWNPNAPDADIQFPSSWWVSIPLAPLSTGEGEGIAEGLAEGVAEGATEGVVEGTAEGVAEGISEGSTEGAAEGSNEGVAGEGAVEGLEDGSPEGTNEGLAEGLSEGSAEGLEEGTAEGLVEGVQEGVSEGSTEGEGTACPTAPHSADVNGDFTIALQELLRVIQFFNSSGFHCAPGTAPDGYAPGASGDQTCCPHHSDFVGGAPDWLIALQELLRLIQFFNSGGYRSCELPGPDGFCPGQ